MALHTPGDHSMFVSTLSTADAEETDIGQRVTLELDKLLKKAKAESRVIISHTVTFFERLETVVLTLHTAKA